MLRELIDPIVTLVYPQRCLSCGGLVESLRYGAACRECWNSTRIFCGTETLCRKCGAYLEAINGNGSTQCRECIDAQFDLAMAAGIYESALSACVISLKRAPHLCDRARELLFDLSMRLDRRNAFIVPIPLSKRRRLERGFNQADVIAQTLAKATHLPILNTALSRIHHTPLHRVGMDRKARQATVRRAFQVSTPRLIDGRNIILVDDVLTSGATASACARELKKKGAGSVTVVTLARASM